MEQQWSEADAKFDDVLQNGLGLKVSKKEAQDYFNLYDVVKIQYDCYLCQKGL